MNTRDIADEYRLAHWSGIMQERKESGLNVRTYCKNSEVSESQYYYWQRKLRKAACGGLSLIPSRIPDLASPVLTKVDLSTSPAPLPVTDIHRNQISVEFAGIRLTAGSEYPVSNLMELLRVVAGQ